jgi:hypothetical protein
MSGDPVVNDEEMEVWRDAGLKVKAFVDARTSKVRAAVFKDDGLIFVSRK